MSPPAPLLELNARARDVFRAVVEAYLENGQPVGSRTIAQQPHFTLSPASIRHVMQDLEEMGLLAAPHTSAGRIPTDSGLRLFVDGMMHVAAPTPAERAAIETQLRGTDLRGGSAIEDALAATSAALSGLSACAGLVMVPKKEPVLRQLGFAPLSPGQAMAVLVGQDGSIENRVITVPASVGPAALVEAANYFNAQLAGMTLSQAQAQLAGQIAGARADLTSAAEALIREGLAAWSADHSGRQVLIVRGQANLLDDSALHNVERVRQLLEQLEGKEDIARLLQVAHEGTATRIFIGSENKLFALSGSSVIAAPWHGKDGKIVGVVGVIGPTRLNYARIVPMVDFTAKTLSRLIR